MSPNASALAFDQAGFEIVDDVIAPHDCDAAVSAIASRAVDGPGTRDLLEHAWCRALARTVRSDARIATLLPAGAVSVQCTLFDKSAEANWLVAYHQDLSIPVREHVASPHCSGWSIKSDGLFVQPPLAVLEALVAVRIHLDPCMPDNGPLRVVPGSHRHGRLAPSAIAAQRATSGEAVCAVGRGGALVLKPLLLHASSKARAPERRRVLHFLFGPATLPENLRWRTVG